MESKNSNSIAIGPAFKHGWKAFWKNPVNWSLAVIIVVFAVLPAMLLELLPGSAVLNLATLGIPIVLATWVLQLLFLLGLIRMSLEAAAGEPIHLRLLVNQYSLLMRFLGTSFVFLLIYSVPMMVVIGIFMLLAATDALWPAILVGLSAGIVGFYISARLYFVVLYFVAENAGVLDSFRESWALTRGHVFKLIGFMIVAAIVNVIGVLLLGLGLLVAIPVSAVAQAHIFKKLSNEPISDPSIPKGETISLSDELEAKSDQSKPAPPSS